MGLVGSVVYALACTAVIVTMPYLFRGTETGRLSSQRRKKTTSSDTPSSAVATLAAAAATMVAVVANKD